MNEVRPPPESAHLGKEDRPETPQSPAPSMKRRIHTSLSGMPEKAARIMRIWKGRSHRNHPHAGKGVVESRLTMHLEQESMIDSNGKIMADNTTKYMMLRPVHPRRESM